MGSRRLPAECLRRLEGADVIFHCGDFVSADVLEELRALGPVEAVYGNMDEPALKEALPELRVVQVEGVRIGMVHVPGPQSGRSARLASRFPDAQGVVYGHTHVAERVRVAGVWILNPGSPTERRRAPSRTMLELGVDGAELQPRVVDLNG